MIVSGSSIDCKHVLQAQNWFVLGHSSQTGLAQDYKTVSMFKYVMRHAYVMRQGQRMLPPLQPTALQWTLCTSTYEQSLIWAKSLGESIASIYITQKCYIRLIPYLQPSKTPSRTPLSGNFSYRTSYVSIAPSRARLLALFCMVVSISLYTDTLRVGSLRYID